MNLWDVIIDSATECELGAPTTTSKVTINDYCRWANRGQDIIANTTDCIEKLITFSSVAKQLIYTPGSEFIRSQRAEYIEGTSALHPLNFLPIAQFRDEQIYNFSTGTPAFYTIWNGKVHIFPPVGSSATATTLSGNITAADTTIGVASTSGFASRGRAYHTTEEFEYTGTTATSFTGCTRGVGGTTAVAGTSGAAITERDIAVYSSVRYLTRPYRIHNTGTVTATLASASITAGSTAPLFSGNIYPGDQIGIGTNPTKFYDITVVSTALTISAVYAETTATNSAYIVSPNLDIPQEYSNLLSTYMCYRTLKMLERETEATSKLNEFRVELMDCRSAMWNRGDEPPGMTDLGN